MARTLAQLALALVVSLASCSVTFAQEDEEYRFDGTPDDPNYANDPNNLPYDPTDWMTSVNWNDGGADPFPPFGPEIPDFGTSAEIVTSNFGVDAPEIGPGDVAEAFDVRIGRFAGAGLLTMSGGTLTTVDSCLASPFTCNRRIRVGAAQVALPQDRNPGTFNLSDGIVTTDTLWIGSGSTGTMNMSGGTVNIRSNFSFDWTFDASSTLNMTDGVINVGTVFTDDLRMYRNSVLNLDGGEILVTGDLNLGLEGDPASQSGVEPGNVTVSVTAGLLRGNDSMMINGTASVSGGVLRADSFNETDSTGTIEISGGGLLQFDNSEESVLAIEALITGGTIFTNDPSGLLVSIVDVSGTNFTQVAINAGVSGDFDMNGRVDASDFLLWQRDPNVGLLSDWEANYGTPIASAVTSVPEPSSIAVALLFSLSIGLRIRRLHPD